MKKDVRETMQAVFIVRGAEKDTRMTNEEKYHNILVGLEMTN